MSNSSESGVSKRAFVVKTSEDWKSESESALPTAGGHEIWALWPALLAEVLGYHQLYEANVKYGYPVGFFVNEN